MHEQIIVINWPFTAGNMVSREIMELPRENRGE